MKLSVKLNQDYRSFSKNFYFLFDGNLILLSGVNGAGKSQILNIINGHEGKSKDLKISSTITIDSIPVKPEEIEFRSFKENISIPGITQSTSQTFLRSVATAWKHYNENLLNPSSMKNIQFSDSCI